MLNREQRGLNGRYSLRSHNIWKPHCFEKSLQIGRITAGSSGRQRRVMTKKQENITPHALVQSFIPYYNLLLN